MMYTMKDAEKSEQEETEFGERKPKMVLSPAAPLPHVRISGSPAPWPSSCPSRPSCQRELRRGHRRAGEWTGRGIKPAYEFPVLHFPCQTDSLALSGPAPVTLRGLASPRLCVGKGWFRGVPGPVGHPVAVSRAKSWLGLKTVAGECRGRGIKPVMDTVKYNYGQLRPNSTKFYQKKKN